MNYSLQIHSSSLQKKVRIFSFALRNPFWNFPWAICTLTGLSSATAHSSFFNISYWDLLILKRMEFKFVMILLVYLFAGSLLLLKLFSSCSKWGLLSSCGMWAALAVEQGFQGVMALAVAAQRLGSCGSQALEHWLNSCGAKAELFHDMWHLCTQIRD